jgi:microcompartment protein CcmL/EutN
MVKRAAVELIWAKSIHPGKYLILVRGAVEEVKEAYSQGRISSAEMLVDHLFLPFPHQDLDAVLDGPLSVPLDSIGIMETFSVASVIRGADAALKHADVRGVSLKLADDLGGKGYFVFTGALRDVEAAMTAGLELVGNKLLAGHEIIANPHPDLLKTIG